MREKYDPLLIKYRDLVIEINLLKLKYDYLNKLVKDIEVKLYDRLDRALLLIESVNNSIEGKRYHEINYSKLFHKLEIARTILKSVEDILKEVGLL
ncbi:MAG: hypothetical protein DRO40_06630 [Thermoprotei archaeon]|nr:MAG: hypothetical protein DRO40_06630 [Thermoprotei archaeon]